MLALLLLLVFTPSLLICAFINSVLVVFSVSYGHFSRKLVFVCGASVRASCCIFRVVGGGCTMVSVLSVASDEGLTQNEVVVDLSHKSIVSFVGLDSFRFLKHVDVSHNCIGRLYGVCGVGVLKFV